MKVAYWPGCVSRGFTPELHGSMAKVAPLLDIELIELDRAACCGAGVIAEHNQELADTLNARTFALAQRTDGELMMNICSTCQGAQSECQERLDANTEYREHVNGNLSDEGLRYEKDLARPLTNKNFLWLLVENIGLDTLKAKVTRPLSNLKVGPFYGCYIIRPAERLGLDEEHPARPLPALGDRGARRHRDRLRRRLQVLRLPDHHDEQGGIAQTGRPAPRRRDRRRSRLPGRPLPAMPPQPRPPAAGRREGRRPRARDARAAPAPTRRARPRAVAQGARDEQAHRQADLGDRLVDLGRRRRCRMG